MDRRTYLGLLDVSKRLEIQADRRISFDSFIEKVTQNQDNSFEMLKKAREVKSLLNRSGFPELASKVKTVIDGIIEMSDLIDTLRTMHGQGNLKFKQ